MERSPLSEDEDAGIAAFIAALKSHNLGPGYRRMDRYRDFHRVFFESDEGRRVFSQIISLCEGPAAHEGELNNPGLLAGRAWTRRVGLQISQWATIPPPEGVPD
jgi:hypothetical protein